MDSFDERYPEAGPDEAQPYFNEANYVDQDDRDPTAEFLAREQATLQELEDASFPENNFSEFQQEANNSATEADYIEDGSDQQQPAGTNHVQVQTSLLHTGFQLTCL